MLYPTVSNYINSMHQSKIISTYSEKIEKMNQAQHDAILDEAKEYNRRLLETSSLCQMTDYEINEYYHCLNLDGKGMMGYIEIPVLKVSLPIYHGTDKKILQTSIGHLEGTSLPIGGESSHCVLSGHRGLPKAKLFTDLNKLSEGDFFIVKTLDQVLTYEVDQIMITDPKDREQIQIVKGKDYCTLITCTPYGINTQRLLVRGRRIDNPKSKSRGDKDTGMRDKFPWIFIFTGMISGLMLIKIRWRKSRKYRRKNSENSAH